MDFLEKILEAKQKEVERLKKQYKGGRPVLKRDLSLIQQLRNAEEMQVIAEIKRASPSKGEINHKVDPAAQAAAYEKAGAAAISVLTDTPYFKGSIEDLDLVSRTVNLPTLCKDFIIDEIQIDRAGWAGAQVILLIAAALHPERLLELYRYAVQQGFEVLVEVHNEAELEAALKVSPELIGVNNRNLKTFQVDLSITEKLGALLKKQNQLFISESGITCKEDVKRVREAGASGILAGESLMKSPDIKKKITEFRVV